MLFRWPLHASLMDFIGALYASLLDYIGGVQQESTRGTTIFIEKKLTPFEIFMV